MSEDDRTKLTHDQIMAGLVFEREVGASQAALQQAMIGRSAFIAYLRSVLGVPDDWELHDWDRGFVPPDAGHEH